MPSSWLVPASRIVIGSVVGTSSRAAMMPRATSSPRVMPPKMLISTARTSWSDRMMRRPVATCCEEAPPDTSRKLAGPMPCSPPKWPTRSIVAIASPAPLTMQPI